jgi:NarL family two-component system response regulator LiaR
MEKMRMNNSDVIRLLIVDDHKVVRNGLKIFISTFDEIELVGEAQNGRQALEQCAQHQPDVVLMDLVMPIMDGLTAIQHIREQFPEINIVALTSYDDEDLIHRAMAAGAIGYLYKDAEEEELIGAIRAAYEGRSIVAPEAIQALVNQIARKEEQATLEPLTKRELEVLALVAQGMTNPQIAKQLVISPSTVNFHLHNILPKLQAGTRTEAVRIAIKNKVIEI